MRIPSRIVGKLPTITGWQPVLPRMLGYCPQMRVVDLAIQDIAFGGKGVGRDQGKAVFVPYVIENERVSAEVVREKKQFAEADLVEVKEASPHRAEPRCPYFERCGGCAYQHIDYTHQLAIKFRQVRDILQRIGKFRDPPMRPIVPSPEHYQYRNRITVHVQDGVVGFFRRDSSRLIDIEQCPISREEVNRALADLRTQHPRDGHFTLRAEATPRIFSQTNDAVGERLRDLVVSLVPAGSELLVDAYCGSGFFARALVNKCQRVIGIDWDRYAIEAAQEAAGNKENYLAGDVDAELKDVLREAPLRTVLIVDPPNTGLTENSRATILNQSPPIMIYVSCNPSTLARDLREFGEKFTIESVTPLDMFPQTAEIEVVAKLQVKPVS